MAKKKETNILEQITANEALTILKTLAREDKHLKKRIEQIAKKYLISKVNLEDIASEVYFELDSIEVEKVWDQSGRTRYGYVEPTEKACEIFEETVEPFIEELRRYKKLSMDEEAKICCMGILKGLYQFDKESPSEFKDWALDEPGVYFELVLDEWKKGQKDPEDIEEMEDFIKTNLSN